MPVPPPSSHDCEPSPWHTQCCRRSLAVLDGDGRQGAGSSHQPLGKFLKPIAQTTLPGDLEECWAGAWGHIIFNPHTSHSCPWNSGPLELASGAAWQLGSSCSPAPLQSQIGPSSSQAGTPREMNIFRSGKGRRINRANIPSAGRPGVVVKEEGLCQIQDRDSEVLE